MSNFSKVSVAEDARTELHDKLSFNRSRGKYQQSSGWSCGVPFVHAHKNNEEIMQYLLEKVRQ